MSITKETLIDALNLLGTVSLKKIEITELMIGFCWEDLQDIDRDDFDRAIKYFYNSRIFPTSREILEITIGADFNEDWTKIVSIARQMSTSETISGMSAAALLKATACKGVRSALMAIGQADDIGVKVYSKCWHQIKKVDLSGLPPTDVTIGLEDKTTKNIDYPVDHDYFVRTASLIKLLGSREIKTSTARAICSTFPQVRKAEVMAVIDEIEDGQDVVIVGESSVRVRGLSVGIAELAGAIQ